MPLALHIPIPAPTVPASRSLFSSFGTTCLLPAPVAPANLDRGYSNYTWPTFLAHPFSLGSNVPARPPCQRGGAFSPTPPRPAQTPKYTRLYPVHSVPRRSTSIATLLVTPLKRLLYQGLLSGLPWYDRPPRYWGTSRALFPFHPSIFAQKKWPCKVPIPGIHFKVPPTSICLLPAHPK